MKSFKLVLVSVILLGLVFPNFAQRMGPGRRVMPGAGNYWFSSNLDTSKKLLIKGEILEIKKIDRGGYNFKGVHLVVKNKKAKNSIHLGPEFYLINQGIALQKGQEIKINTYQGLYNNKPAYFAVDLYYQGKKVILRDQQGFPFWSRNMNFRRGGMGRGYGRSGRGYYRAGRGYNRRGRAGGMGRGYYWTDRTDN